MRVDCYICYVIGKSGTGCSTVKRGSTANNASTHIHLSGGGRSEIELQCLQPQWSAYHQTFERAYRNHHENISISTRIPVTAAHSTRPGIKHTVNVCVRIHAHTVVLFIHCMLLLSLSYEQSRM